MSGAPTLTTADLAARGFRVVNGRAVRIATPDTPDAAPEPKPSGPRYRSKVERLYADYLDLQLRVQAIRSWEYEALSLRLARKLWYRADWLVIAGNGEVQVHETKGRRVSAQHQRGIAKLRIAARLYPMFTFYLVTRSSSGTFTRERIPAE